MPETDHPLHDIVRRLVRIEERFLDIITAPTFDEDLAMTLLSDIAQARADVQAVTAALGTDISTAVANQKAADDAANAANINELSSAQAEVTGLLSDIAALKVAAGIPVAPPAGPLTVSPVSFTATGGSQSSPLAVSAPGLSPFTVTGLPAGVTSDGVNVTDDGSAVAGTTTATVTDSSSPALTGPLDVTVS
jgi:hypothetical protein